MWFCCYFTNQIKILFSSFVALCRQLIWWSERYTFYARHIENVLVSRLRKHFISKTRLKAICERENLESQTMEAKEKAKKKKKGIHILLRHETLKCVLKLSFFFTQFQFFFLLLFFIIILFLYFFLLLEIHKLVSFGMKRFACMLLSHLFAFLHTKLLAIVIAIAFHFVDIFLLSFIIIIYFLSFSSKVKTHLYF